MYQYLFNENEEEMIEHTKETHQFGKSSMYRILSLEERQCFTQDAYDFFMKLIYHDMIDIETQEEILDKCLELYPEKVTLDILKGIFFYLSMKKPGFMHQSLIHCLNHQSLH